MYPHNISISIICPGPVETDITKHIIHAPGYEVGKVKEIYLRLMKILNISIDFNFIIPHRKKEQKCPLVVLHT